jgi:hypothetical protein
MIPYARSPALARAKLVDLRPTQCSDSIASSISPTIITWAWRCCRKG